MYNPVTRKWIQTDGRTEFENLFAFIDTFRIYYRISLVFSFCLDAMMPIPI